MSKLHVLEKLNMCVNDSWSYEFLKDTVEHRACRPRTLKDMSEEEIRVLERQYGVPVKRPEARHAVQERTTA